MATFEGYTRVRSNTEISRAMFEKVHGTIVKMEAEQIKSMLVGSSVRNQALVLSVIYIAAELVDSNGEQPRDFASASASIVWKLNDGVKKYKDNAYKVSEAQIGMVIGQCLWLARQWKGQFNL